MVYFAARYFHQKAPLPLSCRAIITVSVVLLGTLVTVENRGNSSSVVDQNMILSVNECTGGIVGSLAA